MSVSTHPQSDLLPDEAFPEAALPAESAAAPERGRGSGIEKLAAFTRLAACGDIEDGSVLAEAVKASPWFAEQVRQAAEQAWRQGVQVGKAGHDESHPNPYARVS